ILRDRPWPAGKQQWPDDSVSEQGEDSGNEIGAEQPSHGWSAAVATHSNDMQNQSCNSQDREQNVQRAPPLEGEAEPLPEHCRDEKQQDGAEHNRSGPCREAACEGAPRAPRKPAEIQEEHMHDREDGSQRPHVPVKLDERIRAERPRGDSRAGNQGQLSEHHWSRQEPQADTHFQKERPCVWKRARCERQGRGSQNQQDVEREPDYAKRDEVHGVSVAFNDGYRSGSTSRAGQNIQVSRPTLLPQRTCLTPTASPEQ